MLSKDSIWYYQKIDKFMELHFLIGKKCSEFVKCACLEKIHEKVIFVPKKTG